MSRSSPIKDTPLGQQWLPEKGDVYVVTGVLVNGSRFKPIRTASWPYARGINLYRGSRWLERDGKRYLINRVYN